MVLRRVGCWGLSFAIVATVAAQGVADYVFVQEFGEVSRFADDGTQLRHLLARTGVEEAPTFSPFIDEVMVSVEVASDGFIHTVGNSLGTLTLRRFDPETGLELEGNSYQPFRGEYSNPQGDAGWFSYSPGGRRCPYERAACGSLSTYSGRLDQVLEADAFGGLWSFGAIEQHLYSDGYLNSTYVYGQGISRYQVGSNSLPIAVAQFSAGSLGEPAPYELIDWPEHSFLDLDIRPGTADAFVSTPHGLFELARYGIPSQLRPGLFEFQAPVNDPNDPASPFRSDLPWMHPLASGDGWEFRSDLLCKLTEESDSLTLVSYDPEQRVLSDRLAIEGIDGAGTVTDWFFDDDGNLLILVTSDPFVRASGSNSQRNYTYHIQSLFEVDPTNGDTLRTVFEIERQTEPFSDYGPDFGLLTSGIYVATIPEPTGSVLVIGLGLGLAGRRS